MEMIEDHLEANLEGDANEIEDNLEMGVDVNKIEDHLKADFEGDVILDLVPPVQREVDIQDLEDNAWVNEYDKEAGGENDFIEDTQTSHKRHSHSRPFQFDHQFSPLGFLFNRFAPIPKKTKGL
ncbi:unnamed protein product [Lactuca saligna]|uniref:Uncharacterized protein n=1 Tax=Lactuca saligna TaxID=75948 RepID=A0AA36E1V5_LACSI|nr:unnamed protein product [Lactuca saligna]